MFLEHHLAELEAELETLPDAYECFDREIKLRADIGKTRYAIKMRDIEAFESQGRAHDRRVAFYRNWVRGR